MEASRRATLEQLWASLWGVSTESVEGLREVGSTQGPDRTVLRPRKDGVLSILTTDLIFPNVALRLSVCRGMAWELEK